MPKILDNPVRLARIRAGIGQRELASRVGVQRSTLVAIEEARTRTPNAETVALIERELKLAPASLQATLSVWAQRRREAGPQLSPVGRAALAMSPVQISALPNFVAWRSKVAPSPNALASMLGISHPVVTGYERGIRENGMPDTLAHALVTVLGLTNDQLVALQRLEPSER